ncbi:MAG TPA: hypothetical protein VEL10_10610 [Gaiellaceae bacterium]|nr:hypothetical protein [Gaiellaceae bacterium]
MLRTLRGRWTRRLLLIVAAGLAITSVAWAAIPGPGGVITSCYKSVNGQLRVVTGWTVTFKNVDSTSHILGHIIYVICASP